MKTKITAKTISTFTSQTNNLPDYFGDKFWYAPPKNGSGIVNAQFIANKYNAILHIVEETKAKVEVKETGIFITYKTGNIVIDRDVLTDTFLIPNLKN